MQISNAQNSLELYKRRKDFGNASIDAKMRDSLKSQLDEYNHSQTLSGFQL